MRRLTLNTPMRPEHESDLQEENTKLIPAPLFAGQELSRQILPSAKNTFLESLDTIDEVDKFLDSFQQEIAELRTRQELTRSSRELKTIPEEFKTIRCPSSGSLDLQELIDNKAFFVGEADIGDGSSGDCENKPQSNILESSSEATALGIELYELLLSDVCIPKPLALRKVGVNRANNIEPFTTPMPMPNTNSTKALRPEVSKPGPLLTGNMPVAHRWNGNRLNSIVLPPRGGIDVGRSRASTFVDYKIHQELTQYEISSDNVRLKTPPVSPKTPPFSISE